MLMNKLRLLRLFSIVILILGGVMAVMAWRAGRQSSVVVEWTTASELDTVGFNIYRSEIKDGEFVQVNSSLIPAASDPLTGSSYKYEDQAVQPGQKYYYLLEDVDSSGTTTRHGPIEVTAQQGGLSELAAALVLACIGMVSLFGRVFGRER